MPKRPIEKNVGEILEIFHSFRDLLLSPDFAEETSDTIGPDEVNIVVVDVGDRESTITVMSTLGGTAGFYTDVGEGQLDVTSVPDVRRGASELVAAASDYVDRMHPGASPAPPETPPDDNHARFTFGTASGLYSWNGSLEDVYSSAADLGPFMDLVMKQLELMVEHMDDKG